MQRRGGRDSGGRKSIIAGFRILVAYSGKHESMCLIKRNRTVDLHECMNSFIEIVD